jgi:glycogen operon protein
LAGVVGPRHALVSEQEEHAAPLGILAPGRTPFDWGNEPRPRHEHDAVVYELHVRGFTAHSSSGVKAERRGCLAGLIDKIPVVELMPGFQLDPQEGNYWGYSPLSFFALHHAYCSCRSEGGELHEFREIVRALHEADIEIVLDVVYNHTAEQDEKGPTYSLRGVDNATYYLLEEDRSRYRNDSGCGNVLHTGNRFVRQLVLDSLRFPLWGFLPSTRHRLDRTLLLGPHEIPAEVPMLDVSLVT